MTRAQETANLVEAQLTNLPFTRSATHLLREGAPFPPEPPIHTWRPDDKVGAVSLTRLSFVRIIFTII